MAYLIGEIGSNYKSVDDLFKAIPIAKEIGLDCFKIQWFSEFDLYGDGPKERQFPLSVVANLRHLCNEIKIDFMCTAFSSEGYKLIDEFVIRHKVACSERADKSIIDIVTSFNKDYFISLLPGEHPDDLNLSGYAKPLLCVPEYPCNRLPLEELNKAYYDPYWWGVSDHTNTIEQTITAAKMVSVIEKHWNPFNYTDTPDACCSISTELMKELITRSKTSETWTNKYERQSNGYRPRF